MATQEALFFQLLVALGGFAGLIAFMVRWILRHVDQITADHKTEMDRLIKSIDRLSELIESDRIARLTGRNGYGPTAL